MSDLIESPTKRPKISNGDSPVPSKPDSQTCPPIRILAGPAREPTGPLVAMDKWHSLPPWILFGSDGGRGPGKRYLSLEEDPLFNDNGDPCLFPILPTPALPRGRGAAIIVPGGNYEFLGNTEAEPIARWCADALGIEVYVLKYRLLPWAGLQERQQDFYSAVSEARRRTGRGGPIMAIGFSAGGHLIASACAESTSPETSPDAVALVYPQIDPDEWREADRAGFWHTDMDTHQVKSCQVGREKMLPGPQFVKPPPLFVASSTGDEVCPPEVHSDPYVAAAQAAGVSVTVLRGDLGGHGLGLQDFWAVPCLAWAKKRGFGREVSAVGGPQPNN